MKRMLCLFLVLLLALQLCACGSDPVPPETTVPVVDAPDADIYGTWHGSPEMGSPEVTINRDGTCLINGQTSTWKVALEEENSIQLCCEDGTNLLLTDYERCELGFPYLYHDQYGVMLPAPMLWDFRGFWETDFGDNGLIDEYDCQFSNTFIEGRMEITQEDDAVICVVTAEDGSQQVVRMHYVDGYAVVEITDTAGEVHMFYNPENRPPVNTQEIIYREAVKKLNTVINGGRIFYEEDSNKSTGGCNAYAYVYSLFEQLGDYKDAQQYLANFRIIEDVLVDIKEPGEGFNTSLLYVYGEHDAQGRRLTGRVDVGITSATDLGFYACGAFYELTYGEDGLVSQILTHDGDDREPYAVGIPSYDDKGNMISLDVTWYNKIYGTITYTSCFTYDDQGRRLTYEIPDVKDEQTSYGRYYYDDDGKLLQITVDTIKNGKTEPRVRTIHEYIYDDNGVLIEDRYHYNMAAYPYEWIYGITKYTYDSSGKVLDRTSSSGYVYAFRDEEGNHGASDDRFLVNGDEEEIGVFGRVMDYVFGRESWDLVEHDWLIDTTDLELEWGFAEEGNGPGQVREWKEHEYIYTDVYIYCPEH